MDGAQIRPDGLNASVLSQLGGGVLDDSAVVAFGLAKFSTAVSENMIDLAISEPEAARGLVKCAAFQLRQAATCLDDWRERGRQAPYPAP